MATTRAAPDLLFAGRLLRVKDATGEIQIEKDAITFLQKLADPLTVVSVHGAKGSGKTTLVHDLVAKANENAEELATAVELPHPNDVSGVWLYVKRAHYSSVKYIAIIDRPGFSGAAAFRGRVWKDIIHNCCLNIVESAIKLYKCRMAEQVAGIVDTSDLGDYTPLFVPKQPRPPVEKLQEKMKRHLEIKDGPDSDAYAAQRSDFKRFFHNYQLYLYELMGEYTELAKGPVKEAMGAQMEVNKQLVEVARLQSMRKEALEGAIEDLSSMHEMATKQKQLLEEAAFVSVQLPSQKVIEAAQETEVMHLQGYLIKQGGGGNAFNPLGRRNWKQRYFILTGDSLCYAKTKDEYERGKIIKELRITGCRIEPSMDAGEGFNIIPPESGKSSHVYELQKGLFDKNSKKRSSQADNGRIFKLRAQSIEERDAWIEKLRHCSIMQFNLNAMKPAASTPSMYRLSSYMHARTGLQTSRPKRIAVPQEFLVRDLKEKRKFRFLSRKLTVFVTFVVIYVAVLLLDRDISGRSVVRRIITKELLDSTRAASGITYSAINSISEFWDWFSNSFLEIVYSTTDSTGLPRSPDELYTIASHTTIVGGFHLSQRRYEAVEVNSESAKGEQCYSTLLPTQGLTCFATESDSQEPFGSLNGTNTSATQLASLDMFRYTTSTHSTSGFQTFFLRSTTNGDAERERVKLMQSYRWIDRQTKSVEITMPLYNRNLKLWSIVNLQVDFDLAGGVTPNSFIHVTNLEPYDLTNKRNVVRGILEIIFVVHVVYFFLLELWDICVLSNGSLRTVRSLSVLSS
ncbi:hypothetical protein ATCC90586_004681 [Pythium insidiosum]|nr:hypothetical protein ATCC90586_004681 [Pythium insidiosum]